MCFCCTNSPLQPGPTCCGKPSGSWSQGGGFVLADSVQLADSPQYTVAMENFRRVFHEPYYRDSISDDIGARLRQSGFVDITAETHFMIRVWSARKPT